MKITQDMLEAALDELPEFAHGRTEGYIRVRVRDALRAAFNASEQPAIPPHHSLNQRMAALEARLDELTNDTDTGDEGDGIKRVSIGPLGEFAVDRFRDHRGESWEEFAQAIVAQAVELGLVPRREAVDDARLVVTADDIEYVQSAMQGRGLALDYHRAELAIIAYANRVNTARGYTEEAA